jgi:hypothetical protein
MGRQPTQEVQNLLEDEFHALNVLPWRSLSMGYQVENFASSGLICPRLPLGPILWLGDLDSALSTPWKMIVVCSGITGSSNVIWINRSLPTGRTLPIFRGQWCLWTKGTLLWLKGSLFPRYSLNENETRFLHTLGQRMQRAVKLICLRTGLKLVYKQKHNQPPFWLKLDAWQYVSEVLAHGYCKQNTAMDMIDYRAIPRFEALQGFCIR